MIAIIRSYNPPIGWIPGLRTPGGAKFLMLGCSMYAASLQTCYTVWTVTYTHNNIIVVCVSAMKTIYRSTKATFPQQTR